MENYSAVQSVRGRGISSRGDFVRGRGMSSRGVDLRGRGSGRGVDRGRPNVRGGLEPISTNTTKISETSKSSTICTVNDANINGSEKMSIIPTVDVSEKKTEAPPIDISEKKIEKPSINVLEKKTEKFAEVIKNVEQKNYFRTVNNITAPRPTPPAVHLGLMRPLKLNPFGPVTKKPYYGKAQGGPDMLKKPDMFKKGDMLKKGDMPKRGDMLKKSSGELRNSNIENVIKTKPIHCESKHGACGRQVMVQANYFRILKKPEWFIHQYRVDFIPEVDLLRVRRTLIAEHKAVFGGYIFDGTILFSTHRFIKNNKDSIDLYSKDRDGHSIRIKIKHVGLVDRTETQQLQVLNLILHRAMEGLNLQQISRNFFDPRAKIRIDAFRLEIWPGYITSIRQHERDILLCNEVAHKVMRVDTLYHILTQFVKESTDYQTAFKNEVIGTIVLTDYNNKTYRITDVDFTSSPLTKFKDKGKEQTYAEYYKSRYKLVVRDMKQPLLVSKPTQKNLRSGHLEFTLLVPEFTRATGLTDAMRTNVRLMQAMSEYTRINPDRRIQRLKTFNERLQKSKKSTEVLKLWDMTLDTKLIDIPARILPSEKILFGEGKKYTCDDKADWTREFRYNCMYSHTNIKRWVVIVPQRNITEAQCFVTTCVKAASLMTMSIAEPKFMEINDDRNHSYSTAIDAAASLDPQIVMLVLLNPNEEKYSLIKKKCCIDRPVASQVVTLRTVAPRNEKSAGLMSVATKVVIQMNAKLRGTPWLIDLPVKGLMTIGFDVCHSSKVKSKSYGALVATMDIRASSRYYSSVKEHLKGQELSNDIVMSTTFALKAYQEEHNSLPERIIFYRDGVGDGQLHQVVNNEVKFLRAKLDEIYIKSGHEKGVRLAYVIVSKRINTRYFTNNRNPEPGTVVDDVITLPERYDFYLVSQCVQRGTVAPTNYNVIHDSMGLKPDYMQMLTYKLTHMYYNYTGTCRIPAVCQYAHKLAFLVAESLHRAPSASHDKNLYFL